jgi:hypothetical protein
MKRRLLSGIGRAQRAIRGDTPEGFLTGRLACFAVRPMTEIRSLEDVEFRVSSQWGEDGIIEWLLQRLQVRTRTFVEFGVSDYRESNTRFLLQNRNWRGLVMDGSPENMEFVRQDPLYWRHDLQAVSAFITRENINDLLRNNGFTGEIGILSIDIDGNDLWVWEAIEAVDPVICICEYNSVFGDLRALSVPYDPAFRREQAHGSNLFFGASVAAFHALARRRGYTMVGTNTAGNNVFFVRDDHFARIAGSIEDTSPRPSLFRESRDSRGRLNFLSGQQRLAEISHLSVVDLEASTEVRIGDLGPLYSAAWLEQLGGGSAR